MVLNLDDNVCLINRAISQETTGHFVNLQVSMDIIFCLAWSKKFPPLCKKNPLTVFCAELNVTSYKTPQFNVAGLAFEDKTFVHQFLRDQWEIEESVQALDDVVVEEKVWLCGPCVLRRRGADYFPTVQGGGMVDCDYVCVRVGRCAWREGCYSCGRQLESIY